MFDIMYKNLRRKKVNRYNGMFLVNNKDEVANFKLNFLENNIGMEYESCFLRLLNKVLVKRFDLLVIPFDILKKGIDFLKIFEEGSSFSIPLVVILCDNNEKLPNILPHNYYYVNKGEFPDFFQNFSKILIENQQRLDFLGINTHDYKKQIFNCLTEVGFNFGTNGTTFLVECINNVMYENCRGKILFKSMLEHLALDYSTTSANVSRCMRVAIGSTWAKNTLKSDSTDSTIKLDDFMTRPTIKEFVYYVANKLYNLNREEKLKKFMIGC